MRTATPSLNRLLLPVTLALFVVGHSRASFADKVCVKTASKRGKVTLTSSTVTSNQSCPRGTTQLVDTATLSGPQGPAGVNGTNGSNGTDGSTRIYGDGSAGTISVSADTGLSDPNRQYEDFFVNSGVTLEVASGTVIRSRGTVTINGTINVDTGGAGGKLDSGNTTTGFPYFSFLPATQGHAKRPAGVPEVGSNAAEVYGALAGVGLIAAEARSLLRLGPAGCGSGSAALNRGTGGAGGGSLTILAKNGIIISSSGSISANGGPPSTAGGGGGAGGIIILASSGQVVNGGSISASGGSGGASAANAAAGGGGGGGIVHMLAPAITSGTVTLTAGSVGSTAVSVTNITRRSGGGGGGGCGGRGADGSNVATNNSQTQGSAAEAGQLLTTVTDPVTLF